MKSFDCHTHIENGLEAYDLSVSKRNIIFNSIESYKKHSASVPEGDAVSLILDTDQFDFVASQIRSGRIQALKIHSRIQKIRQDDYQRFHAKLKLVPADFPVIIDCFYYGNEMDYQPNLKEIVSLINSFPRLRVVIAHAGGYELLKYFFHLRELSNVWYDLSFSLQYLHDSSVFTDLKKLVRYTDRSRVMFGSDYHYTSPRLQHEILTGLLKELDFSEEQVQKIFFHNAENLFFSR